VQGGEVGDWRFGHENCGFVDRTPPFGDRSFLHFSRRTIQGVAVELKAHGNVYALAISSNAALCRY